MKCTDMEKSSFSPFTACGVGVLVAGFVSAGQAQEIVQTIERAPQSVFDTERDEALAKFLDLGPISVRPHLYIDAYYDDNVSLRRSHKQEDFVWHIAPGALFGAGEFRGDKGTYVSLDYTMRGSIYPKHDGYDSLDHDVIMSGGWKLSKLTLGLSQAYEIENGKQVEVGAFVEEEAYTTLLTSKYELSDKTFFELNGRQSLICSKVRILDAPDFKLNAINEWLAEAWGGYKATEKITAGVGGTIGWRDIRGFANGATSAEVTPNETFEQALVRASYRATEKLDLNGSAGLQFSQFQDGDDKGPSLVFTLGGSWQPLERTSVSLEGYRRDVPSFGLNGQNYTLTGTRASVRQLFLEKYTLSLSGGYENSHYTKNSSSVSGGSPTYDYFWIRPGLDYQFNERWVTGLFYQYRTKNSNLNSTSLDLNHDYSNNQVGIYSSYRF